MRRQLTDVGRRLRSFDLAAEHRHRSLLWGEMIMASVPEARLLAFLRQNAPTPVTNAEFKRTLQEFVLQYGWWYEPSVLPARIAPGTPQECCKNAAFLTVDDDSLIYCEGYALFRSGSAPRLHAWVTDGSGRAIDNTWPKSGVAYAGVPFRSLFVTMTALKNRATISLLDDYQNLYPLRCDLGDRPDEWLEERGQGIQRLKDTDIGSS
jgi:hypothetical protein